MTMQSGIFILAICAPLALLCGCAQTMVPVVETTGTLPAAPGSFVIAGTDGSAPDAQGGALVHCLEQAGLRPGAAPSHAVQFVRAIRAGTTRLRAGDPASSGTGSGKPVPQVKARQIIVLGMGISSMESGKEVYHLTATGPYETGSAQAMQDRLIALACARIAAH